MEGDFVKGQGEAVSTTVVVDTASVTGYCAGWWRACRGSTRCQSDMRGLVTAGRLVRLVSGSAGLSSSVHLACRSWSGLLIVRSRVTRRRCRRHLRACPDVLPLSPFVLAGSSRRVGGVNMQRPQRSVSGARTNDVDLDERRETIIDEGAGGVRSVEDG